MTLRVEQQYPLKLADFSIWPVNFVKCRPKYLVLCDSVSQGQPSKRLPIGSVKRGSGQKQGVDVVY